jgi:hypothetical protein
MEAATAPGRNLAAGISQLGAGIGQAIQRYQDNKAQNEAAIQTGETLFGMAQQALASDPSYQALQNYYETGQLPPGVTESDLNRFTQKVQADRSMLNRMVAIGDKFGDMSLAKKKAAIGDVAMLLNQYQQRGEQETTRALREAQLAQAQIAVGQAKAEEAGQKQLSDALRAAYGVQAGQAPAVPFRSVTSELLSRYGNLTPAMQAQVAGIAEQRAATPPAGMVPIEATMTVPGGGKVTLGRPSGPVEYRKIPGSNKMQMYQNGEPKGTPFEAENLAQIEKQRALTIDQGEFQGVAPTQKEADEYRDLYAKTLDSRTALKRLLEIADMNPILQQDPVIATEAKNLVSTVQGAQRLQILGPGVVTEYDQKILNALIPDPTKLFSLSASNKKALQGALDRANAGLKNKATTLGLKPVGVSESGEIPVGQPITSSQGIPRFMSVEEANATLGPGKTAMVRNPKTGQMQQYTTE